MDFINSSPSASPIPPPPVTPPPSFPLSGLSAGPKRGVCEGGETREREDVRPAPARRALALRLQLCPLLVRLCPVRTGRPHLPVHLPQKEGRVRRRHRSVGR